VNEKQIYAILAVVIIVLATVISAWFFFFRDTEEGGAKVVVAEEGDTVFIHYIGYLHDERVYGNQSRVFDTSLAEVAGNNIDYPKIATFDDRPRGEAFSFVVGSGSVIAGWDKRIGGMQVNTTQTWTIPPAQAYQPYVDNLLVNVSSVEQTTVFEYMTAGDFELAFPGENLAEGLVLDHYFWGWEVEVFDIDSASDNVTLMNLPQQGASYISGYGWSSKVVGVDSAASGGLGNIEVQHLPNLGATVDPAKVVNHDEAFADISSIQSSKQGRSASGIVVGNTGGTISIDFNAEVYGKTLTFVVTLERVEKAPNIDDLVLG